MRLQSQFREIAWLHSQLKRNRSGPSKSLGHRGHAYAENREKSSKLRRKDQLHSLLHSKVDRHVRSPVQDCKAEFIQPCVGFIPCQICL